MNTMISHLLPHSPPDPGRATTLLHLGLPVDPFRFQVTEQAWAFGQTAATRHALLATYQSLPEQKRWFDTLLTPHKQGVRYGVTGTPGSGKTALAWHWMERITMLRPDALVVLFDAAEVTSNSPLSFQYYWANALLKALLLYIADPRHATRPLWIQDVALLRQGGGRNVKRFLDKLLTTDDTAMLIWDTLRRPYWHGDIDPSNTLLRLLCFGRGSHSIQKTVSDFNPSAFLFSLKSLFARLGIEQVYLFIDNVTDDVMEKPHSRWCIRQLLQQTSIGDVPLSSVLFSETEIANFLKSAVHPRERNISMEHYTLDWTPPLLREMLGRRWALSTSSGDNERLGMSFFLKMVGSDAYSTPRTLLAHISELINRLVQLSVPPPIVEEQIGIPHFYHP